MMKKGTTKKKCVKNNLLPVLPFLLSSEEKEQELNKSDEEDFEKSYIFHFFWATFLFDKSLRSLLISDKQHPFLNKILLFSFRGNSPFTRRECLTVLKILLGVGAEEDVKFVSREGGMKCVVSRMRGNEERKEMVKENGKSTFIYCLCKCPYGDRSLYRMKEGWKSEEIMREMMWRMEEEDLVESVIMWSSAGLDKWDGVSINDGLGVCRSVK
jgi:hypothetical protein